MNDLPHHWPQPLKEIGGFKRLAPHLGYASELAEAFGHGEWSGLRLRRGDGDRARCVLGEGGQVARVAGEDIGGRCSTGAGGDDAGGCAEFLLRGSRRTRR